MCYLIEYPKSLKSTPFCAGLWIFFQSCKGHFRHAISSLKIMYGQKGKVVN